MKAVIITNVPTIISEKDLFTLVAKATPNLKRIILADDPNAYGRTINIAVANYLDHYSARVALDKFRGNVVIFDSKVQAVWKEPAYDVISELSTETPCVYIKNLAFATNAERIKTLLTPHGKVLRVKKFMDRAFVEFDTISAAKRSLEAFQERRIDGMVWKILPAKRYDEEREREEQDKNLTFSKNFLDQADQQTLLKFAYSGMLPDFNAKVFLNAKNILDQSQHLIQNNIQMLKMQYESMQSGPSFADGRQNPGLEQHQNDGFMTNAENVNSSEEEDDISEGGVSVDRRNLTKGGKDQRAPNLANAGNKQKAGGAQGQGQGPDAAKNKKKKNKKKKKNTNNNANKGQGAGGPSGAPNMMNILGGNTLAGNLH